MFTCNVEGDLHIKRLQIELDAKFNGTCRMISEDEFASLTQNLVSNKLPGLEDPEMFKKD